MSMEEGSRVLKAATLERPATIERMREASCDSFENVRDETLTSAIVLEGLDWLLRNNPMQAVSTMASAATLVDNVLNRSNNSHQ